MESKAHKKELNIIPHQHAITRVQQERQKGHKGFVVWLTGLSGSGKSTVADRVEQFLIRAGIHTYILDGDNVRGGLNKGLTFSMEDRRENLRRIAEVAKLFADAGIVVLCAFVSPLEKDREMIQKIVGNDIFAEIFVDAPLVECERRDVKGLYKKARQGQIENFTGISAPYEAPKDPDLRIETSSQAIEKSAREVFEFLLTLKKIKIV